MIFIAVKFTVRTAERDNWLPAVEDFTVATRQEPGNVFFDWSYSVENPDQFVLLEAFASAEAGAAHVQSAHFKAAMETMADLVAEVPEIINVEVPGEGWSRMAEVQPRS
ncbi:MULTISPECIES: putative quinol monooxygenase [unclassified Streptomyces]|uniref:putative quinol monooxygenase n=1 Tax=unclassified Streptomyces TaxID=2593676 RepID=UPI002DD94B5F|nr:putative quinol monooxygenase [Streptomyces sp. NBC_01022]MEE4494893.1 putative quinol monooxygenase [Streptomyces sp. BE230]WRZ85458.1 antibiotic biosynthesis monooxygenase [Streptomyces sp. NBC_01022]